MARRKIYYKVIVRICEVIERKEKKKIYKDWEKSNEAKRNWEYFAWN